MSIFLKPTNPSAHQAEAVLYARVSSKEQDKEGFSIPAQLKLLRDYARTEGLRVAQEYVDVETAKQAGRTNFGSMISQMKATPSVRVLLVEKTDRLYRNLKDWVTLDELDVEIHFVKEGVVLSRDSRSSEKFMHGIKVLMAKNYIDNLSEEARKGMQEKAEQGIWPTVAPLGYLNVTDLDGKKRIEPDPAVAPLIVKLFDWYATGEFSLREIGAKARASGLKYRKSGAPVPTSTVHAVLRNPLYSGEFEWNGRRCQGSHVPLISRDLWERVQGVMDGRRVKKHRRGKRDFAFSRMISCGHCGCSAVGEMKKQKYVYYHCTGHKGKCGEPYVREEVLEQRFTELRGGPHFDDEIMSWVRDALTQSHVDERQEHEAAIGRLQAKYDRLQSRIHDAYVDKLDGRIDAAFFDRMSADWRRDQERCLRDIEQHQTADQSYLEEGAQLLELARNAQRLFAKQEAKEKRRLLGFLVSNCSWKSSELTTELRQPFDLLHQTVAAAKTKKATEPTFDGLNDIWLPGQDSNLRQGG